MFHEHGILYVRYVCMSHEFQGSNGSDEVRLRKYPAASFNCTALESTISCPLYQDVPGTKSDAICWFTDWEQRNMDNVSHCLENQTLEFADWAWWLHWCSPVCHMPYRRNMNCGHQPTRGLRTSHEEGWRRSGEARQEPQDRTPPGCHRAWLIGRPQVRTLWWVERIAGNTPASLLDRTTVATCDRFAEFRDDLEKLLVQGCHHPAFGTYHPLLFSLNVVVSSLLKAEHRSRALLGTEISKWHDRLFQTWRFTDPKVNYEFFPKARNAKETLSAFYQPVAQKCTHRLWNMKHSPVLIRLRADPVSPIRLWISATLSDQRRLLRRIHAFSHCNRFLMSSLAAGFGGEGASTRFGLLQGGGRIQSQKPLASSTSRWQETQTPSSEWSTGAGAGWCWPYYKNSL